MTAAEARLHIRYSGWASRKLLEAASKLNPDDLEKATGVSHGSILGTLAHTYFADRVWFSRAVDPSTQVVRDPVPLETLDAQWTELQGRWEAWVDAISDEDLLRPISYQALDGTPFVTPLWQIVMHLVNHATLHRGQVMAMLRQLGVPPPATDLIFYYRELEQ